MKEVEVKARITNTKELNAKLADLGCIFSEPISQKDVIFLKPPLTILEVTKGTVILRIREANGKIILTLKQQLANELDNIEKEILVSDAGKTREILEKMGFAEVIRVNKIRRKCKYHEIEICIDEVENLGNFIEVEKMTSDEDSLKVQELLFDFLMKLGVGREDRVLEGYDTLLHKKINNIK